VTITNSQGCLFQPLGAGLAQSAIVSSASRGISRGAYLLALVLDLIASIASVLCLRPYPAVPLPRAESAAGSPYRQAFARYPATLSSRERMDSAMLQLRSRRCCVA
jgi:hypothetical protein